MPGLRLGPPMERFYREKEAEIVLPQLNIFPVAYYGFIGLFIGSFLNVCIYRLPRRESLAWPGSHCPACGKGLGPAELVPVLSYLIQGRKCKTCGVKISPRYATVELITGIAFYWAAANADNSWITFLKYAAFLSSLIIVFFVDLDHMIIPDAVVFPLTAFGLLLAAGAGWPALKDSVVAAAAGFAAFYAIATIGTILAGRDAMGFGDVKFAAMLGSFLGMKMLATGLFLSFLIGTLVSLPWVLLKGRKQAIPFGPMMVAGSVIALIWGAEVVNWYAEFVDRLWMQ